LLLSFSKKKVEPFREDTAKMKFSTLLTTLLFLCLMAIPAYAGETFLWFDEEGNAHTTNDVKEVPEQYRPEHPAEGARGVLTELAPGDVKQAVAEGRLLSGSDRLKGGLGLFTRFTYELGEKKGEAYIFVGTKYNLVKAAAALSRKPPSEAYIGKVKSLDRLPVAFYVRGFEPGVLLMKQGDKQIIGEDGFSGADPGLNIARLVKSFSYAYIDLNQPVEVSVYDLDGNVVLFDVDLAEYR
jgi:hypothetical protein